MGLSDGEEIMTDGTGSFGEVGVMEFGLKGTSRLVADVTGSRHSGLGFNVFWLFTAVLITNRKSAISIRVSTYTEIKTLDDF